MGGGTYQTAFYGSVNRLTTMTDPHFIESMQCLAVKRSPEGEAWEYELKLDGYRALAVKRDGLVTLFSRNRKRFKGRFPGIAAAFAKLPDNTIIDGEIVAMDESGRPSFSRLQNFSANAGSITFYAFDMPMWNGKDLRTQPLDKRTRTSQSLYICRLWCSSAALCVPHQHFSGKRVFRPRGLKTLNSSTLADFSLPIRMSRSGLLPVCRPSGNFVQFVHKPRK
jgi:ATP dependent DNA ligase domain